MIARLLLLLITLSASACGGNGPIFPVPSDLDDWVKASDTVDPDSDRSPILTDPVVTFQLERGDHLSALKFSDGLVTGQTRLLGFDIRADPSSVGDHIVDVTRLTRIGDPGVEIVSVQLDAKRGLTVLGRSCVQSSQLSVWHRVEIRIKLRDNDTGFLEIFCDRSPVWARKNIRTTFPPVCRISEGCNLRIPYPAKFEWQIGLISERSAKIPMSVQMQRINQRILIYTPNRAGNL